MIYINKIIINIRKHFLFLHICKNISTFIICTQIVYRIEFHVKQVKIKIANRLSICNINTTIYNKEGHIYISSQEKLYNTN